MVQHRPQSRYGLTGPAQGHFYTVPETGEVKKSEDAYTHPQPHACFIQSVEDDLVNKKVALWTSGHVKLDCSSTAAEQEPTSRTFAVRESPRAVEVSRSGLMSFLKIEIAQQGAIKSVEPLVEPRKRFAWTWTIRTSSRSSSGRPKRKTRVRALVDAGYSPTSTERPMQLSAAKTATTASGFLTPF